MSDPSPASDTCLASDPGLFRLTCRRPLLVARFPQAQRMVSWSLNRPGFVLADEVAWLEVRNADLAEVRDPRAWFEARLAAADLSAAVGLMTSRNVDHHHLATREVEGITASALVTLGLNNGERVGARFPSGDAERALMTAGTVNILAAVDAPLTEAALLEASSIVVQARTRAILEADFRRPGSDEPVSGTGTDCVVIAAPQSGGQDVPYAGLHTAVGEAIGAATLAAMREAVTVWLADPGRFVL